MLLETALGNDSYLAYLDMLLFSLPDPKRIQTPLLVLGAADDHNFSPAEIEATARAYHAPYELFPNMAHDMMLEKGWESVAARKLHGWAKRECNRARQPAMSQAFVMNHCI